MFSTTRLFHAVAILLSGAIAGCTPANYVRTALETPLECGVRVCTDANSPMQRCTCQSSRLVERQLREAGYLPADW